MLDYFLLKLVILFQAWKEEQEKIEKEMLKVAKVTKSEALSAQNNKKSTFSRMLTPIKFKLDVSGFVYLLHACLTCILFNYLFLSFQVQDYSSSLGFESVLANMTSVTDGLIRLYDTKLKPLEIAFGYHEFVSLQMVRHTNQKYLNFFSCIMFFLFVYAYIQYVCRQPPSLRPNQ